MKQQPDKIFHDKLASFSKEVPPMAWDQIERGLENRKRGFFWISVAASVTAVAISAGVYFNFQDNSGAIALKENQQIAEPKDTLRSTNPIPQVRVPETRTLERSTTIPDSENTPAGDLPTVKRKQSRLVKSNHTNAIASTEANTNTEANTKIESEIPSDTTFSSYGQPTKLAFQAPSKSESITIILTTEQTSEYLLTKNTNAKATPDEKKSSTLKKLLKKAADLKVNQDPFGELRQKKNEILALNFRTEKQRGQKK